MALSKATDLALKSQKTYLDDAEWLCFWHRLSDDQLNTQIFTVGHKPTDQIISFYFSDLSAAYKIGELPSLTKFLADKFGVQDASTIAPHAFEFLNDAKLEYTNKAYI